MDYPQFCKFSNTLDAFLKPFNNQPSPSTIAQYLAANKRMQKLNLTPVEISKCKRSYYLNRAALIFCTMEQMRNLHRLAAFAYEHGHADAGHKQVCKIAELIHILKRYPPDPQHMRKSSEEAGEWVTHARANKIVKKSFSKRNTLSSLPPDWRGQMWDGIPKEGKYRTAIAVLSSVGARPSEIERGVRVERALGSGLQFTILGTKTHGGKYGQAQRVITVSVDSPEAQYLENMLSTTGSPLVVTCKPALLKDAVVYVSKKIWPNAKDHVTPYVYRHQVSADLKDDGLAEEQVSEALGHSTVETQRYYGQRRQGRGGGTRLLGVKASRSVKARRRIYRGPTSGGPKRGSP